MKKQKCRAVVAGHICLDITPAFPSRSGARPEAFFAAGKLTVVDGVTVSTGGAASNTGIALSMLGVPTRIMGKIGDDYFGEGILRILRERNLHEGMIVVPGGRTSYTVVLAPPGFDRMFLHDPGANDTFRAQDVDYDTVAEADLFHFGYPPIMRLMYEDGGRELVDIFRRVRDLGVTTSLDMCLPDPNSPAGRVDWDAVLRRLLPLLDIFTPSVEELMFMVDRDAFEKLNVHAGGADMLEHLDFNVLERLGTMCMAYGARIALIKCGIKGVYVRTTSAQRLEQIGQAKPGNLTNWADRELLEESFHVPHVASTTGSGDTCIAGFLAAYLNGMSVEDSVRVACGVGAQSCRRFDAFSGLLPFEETLASLSGPVSPKNKVSPSGDYWQYDAERAVWVGRRDAQRGGA